MDLKGKVAVITGGSTGIGQELGFQLAAKGCAVALAARSAALLEANAERIRAGGGRALAVPTDVARRPEVEALMRRAFEAFGRIDVVVNNAGISPAKGTILENEESDVRATLDVNFMGSLYGLWAAAPYLEKAGGGVVVFVSSIVGKRGVPLNAAYCASKFALQGLTESIRPELAARNIRVVTICPPGVDTPFFRNNDKGETRRYRIHPVGKITRRIVRAIETEKREALLTADAWFVHWTNVLAPSLVDRVVARLKGV